MPFGHFSDMVHSKLTVSCQRTCMTALIHRGREEGIFCDKLKCCTLLKKVARASANLGLVRGFAFLSVAHLWPVQHISDGLTQT